MLRRLALLAALAISVWVAAGSTAAANTLQANCSNFGTQLTAAGAGDTIVLTGLCTDQSHPLPATANLTIEGAATGTNGFNGNGAGAPALSGSNANGLTLKNLIFENYASSGVSIHTTNVGNPYTIVGDTFSHNTAVAAPPAGNGGGLDLEPNTSSACPASGPNITVSGSTFIGNSAPGVGLSGANGGGGGAFLNLECAGTSTSIVVTGNTFTGNSVAATSTNSRNGGGLWVGVGPSFAGARINLTQSGNLFSGNSVTGSGGSYAGGGEFTFGANITSSGDRFLGNSLSGPANSVVSSEGAGLSTRTGGSCSSPSGSTSTATNLVAVGNTIAAPTGMSAGGEGAGIYAGCTVGTGGYDLTLVNSTVSGNQDAGGGVAGIDGEATDLLTLRNTIVKGNLGGADLDGFGASPGANVTAANSDVCAIGGGPFAGPGNICADPALANVATGDVHETSSSPTIDKGSNAFVGSLTTDVFGGPRVLVGKPGDAAIVDIGAAEIGLPSNGFTIDGVKGKTLFVTVNSPGKVVVIQTGAGSSRAAVEAKKKKKKKKSKLLLNPSSATGGPGQVAVPLLLTKKGKQRLKKKGKVALNATVTFTPTGGEANSKTTSLKIKGKKKKKKK